MKKIFWILLIILIIILLLYFCGYKSRSWENVRITEAEGMSTYPAATWDGSGYGLVWVDGCNNGYYSDIFFTRINRNGEKLIGDIVLNDSTSTISNNPDIAWTGSEYGVVWQEIRRERPYSFCGLYFNRLDADGNKLGEDILIATTSQGTSATCPENPVIKWTGSEYGVTWQKHFYSPYLPNTIVFFNRLNTLGEKQLGDDVKTNDEMSSKNPSMAWTGSGYGLAWKKIRNDMGIYFFRLGEYGMKETGEIEISSSSSWIHELSAPSIAWNDSDENFGIVWSERNSYDPDPSNVGYIYLSIIDEDGNKQVEDIAIVSDDNLFHASTTMVWADDEYGIAWQRENIPGGGRGLIEFAAFDENGNMKDGVIQIPESITTSTPVESALIVYSEHPDLVWGGGQYGIVWDDSRDGNGAEIYFAASRSCFLSGIFSRIKSFFSGLF